MIKDSVKDYRVEPSEEGATWCFYSRKEVVSTEPCSICGRAHSVFRTGGVLKLSYRGQGKIALTLDIKRRPEADDCALSLGWKKWGRHDSDFVKTLTLELPGLEELEEAVGALEQEMAQIAQAAKRTIETREAETSKMFPDVVGKEVITLHLGADGKKVIERTPPSGWHLVAKWSNRRFTQAAYLYAKEGCLVESLVKELVARPFGDMGDSLLIENGVLIIKTRKMGAWVGSGGWRIKALKAVTKGKIRLEAL